ncbi:mitochondrial cardiolipin hydrolase-like [Lytechinus variegatus]|uniref:mitochondrial cardiolipin hydrolase-like n=1 Tax=Lytechinus variegatus TaxID=7654 RepID=UPI001BB2521D|nr:mitochondrial cardiolipin hydrolase-like [Lytechinus variegatus]XP_041473417.1 mitochondrial cardiolipin hydrolase-like [Lytechinus variegatus]XP_041473418.1 mitochondrial cardiolipin hydrolase-like [Lytechinus variegatus]
MQGESYITMVTVKQVLGLTLVVGLASEVVYYIWRRRLVSRLSSYFISKFTDSQTETIDATPTPAEDSKTFKDPYLYKVLIFPDRVRACKPHFWGDGCRVERCWFSHDDNNSMYQFLSHIRSAETTLDVCVYVMTDAELANFVISMKGRGVLVRIITNQEAQNYTGTQVGKFRSRGIQVRTNINYLMHHKFVVVDRKKVITGSFNWTSHATTANNENMIITDNPQIVDPYVKEFDRLWKMFDPALQS